jgi:hypothetical protein
MGIETRYYITDRSINRSVSKWIDHTVAHSTTPHHTQHTPHHTLLYDNDVDTILMISALGGVRCVFAPWRVVDGVDASGLYSDVCVTDRARCGLASNVCIDLGLSVGDPVIIRYFDSDNGCNGDGDDVVGRCMVCHIIPLPATSSLCENVCVFLPASPLLHVQLRCVLSDCLTSPGVSLTGKTNFFPPGEIDGVEQYNANFSMRGELYYGVKSKFTSAPHEIAGKASRLQFTTNAPHRLHSQIATLVKHI